MKKIFLRIMVYAFCFAFVAGCSKNVKAPVNKATATTNKTTSTQTQDQNTSGHTCGGSSTSNNGGHY